MSSSYPHEALPEEWMPLLARCWDFLTEGGYTAIVIGSQALSLHLLKLSEREKGQLDWRVAFPSKDLDISVPALEREGKFNQEFSGFVRGLEDVAYRGTQTLDLRAGGRGLVAHVFIRLASGRPFTIEFFSTVIGIHPHIFVVGGSRIHLASVSRDFLALSPVDAVVTRLASPAPIELKHVERLRIFSRALGVEPEDVADRLHEVLRPDMVEYLHHNLMRMEDYGIYPGTRVPGGGSSSSWALGQWTMDMAAHSSCFRESRAMIEPCASPGRPSDTRSPPRTRT